tara:strand:- start:859 stop:1569 length:711 start_codon:yes stop_codon:yes gene_type:complete
MTNKLFFVFIILFSFSSYSQKINIGLNVGTGFSSQTLHSENSAVTAGIKYAATGVKLNTIGGLAYRVDSYTGYNAGLMLELYFDLSSTDEDDKTIEKKIGIKSGVNYSSQGVIIEDVNESRFNNNLIYLQIPILIDFKYQKFNIFLGPQIHILQDFNTSNISSNPTSQTAYFKFEKKYYNENDPNFVFGFGFEIYDGLSVQIKKLRSLKNITNIEGEEWKNKSFEITLNYILNNLL